MVRLLRAEFSAQWLNPTSFNPTMVRLLLGEPRPLLLLAMLFQSHNGAIAAEHAATKASIEIRFNPTMVRLLPVLDNAMLEITINSFNPTMVRLLPKGKASQSQRQAKFQSHNGAIAARNSPKQ